MFVEILYRIFQRNDVARSFIIDFIYHSCQSRRLPRPSRTGNQNQPSRQSCELPYYRRKPQRFHGRNPIRDDPKGHCKTSSLPIGVHSKPAVARNSIRKIDLAPAHEPVKLLVGHHLPDQNFCVDLSKRQLAVPYKFAVYPEDRRYSDGYVYVGSQASASLGNNVIYFHGSLLSLTKSETYSHSLFETSQPS